MGCTRVGWVAQDSSGLHRTRDGDTGTDRCGQVRGTLTKNEDDDDDGFFDGSDDLDNVDMEQPNSQSPNAALREPKASKATYVDGL